jgi:PEP-CTERM motif
MDRFAIIAAGGIALTTVSLPAAAAVAVLDFNFLYHGSSVASGDFTYNSADTGLIGWSDVLSFSISFPLGMTYDLGFVNSGNDTVYRYLGFDTASDTFVSATMGGYPEIMSDIKISDTEGFFVRGDTIKIVRDYSSFAETDVPYDNLQTTTNGSVPEPSTWAMMLLGFVGLGFVGYRTSRQGVSVAT